MVKIDKHISELLFDHDCVIVPSLGGFLASNEASKILLPNQVIFPPYRRIAFNVYLKQNDGLLANHLVESENIQYAEAIRIIESFAADCFENLEAGSKVNITEVGTLYYDKEKNIQFDAVRNFNHLRDSFGMEAVHFLPVLREEAEEKQQYIRPSIRLDKNKSWKFINKNGKRLIGASAIGAILIWFSMNLYLAAPKKYESTSLSPFDSQEIIITKSDSIRNMPAASDSAATAFSTTDSSGIVHIGSATDAADTTSEEIAENTQPVITPPETVKTPDLNPREKTTPVTPEHVSGINHYIIAGVFKIKENAQTTLLRLQQLGFTNARIIESHGMNYVSYDNFPAWNDAQALADSLKNKNLEGWIWKH